MSLLTSVRCFRVGFVCNVFLMVCVAFLVGTFVNSDFTLKLIIILSFFICSFRIFSMKCRVFSMNEGELWMYGDSVVLMKLAMS